MRCFLSAARVRARSNGNRSTGWMECSAHQLVEIQSLRINVNCENEPRGNLLWLVKWTIYCSTKKWCVIVIEKEWQKIPIIIIFIRNVANKWQSERGENNKWIHKQLFWSIRECTIATPLFTDWCRICHATYQQCETLLILFGHDQQYMALRRLNRIKQKAVIRLGESHSDTERSGQVRMHDAPWIPRPHYLYSNFGVFSRC